MTTVLVTSPAGKAEGALALPADIFDAPANIPVMHQVVVAQQAAARQGTHAAKTRGQTRGGGKKPYRQKGTGRARQGSTRAPQFVGGGTVHGPVPHGYAQRTPKKMVAAALRGALSDRARGGCVHVLSGVVEGDAPSTRAAAALLQTLAAGRRVLAVVDRDDVPAAKSFRNLPDVDLIAGDQLTAYAVLRSDDVVFTRSALDGFLEFSGAQAATEGKASDAPTKDAPAKTPAVKSTATKNTAAKKAAAPKQAPAKAAVTKKTTAPKQAPAATASAEDDDSGFGPGSHAALEDGTQPDGFPIKGKVSSKLYHVPGSSHYARTTAEVWFDSEESAEAAGFQLPPSQRKAASNEEDSQ